MQVYCKNNRVSDWVYILAFHHWTTTTTTTFFHWQLSCSCFFFHCQREMLYAAVVGKDYW